MFLLLGYYYIDELWNKTALVIFGHLVQSSHNLYLSQNFDAIVFTLSEPLNMLDSNSQTCVHLLGAVYGPITSYSKYVDNLVVRGNLGACNAKLLFIHLIITFFIFFRIINLLWLNLLVLINI